MTQNKIVRAITLSIQISTCGVLEAADGQEFNFLADSLQSLAERVRTLDAAKLDEVLKSKQPFMERFARRLDDGEIGSFAGATFAACECQAELGACTDPRRSIHDENGRNIPAPLDWYEGVNKADRLVTKLEEMFGDRIKIERIDADKLFGDPAQYDDTHEGRVALDEALFFANHEFPNGVLIGPPTAGDSVRLMPVGIAALRQYHKSLKDKVDARGDKGMPNDIMDEAFERVWVEMPRDRLLKIVQALEEANLNVAHAAFSSEAAIISASIETGQPMPENVVKALRESEDELHGRRNDRGDALALLLRTLAARR